MKKLNQVQFIIQIANKSAFEESLLIAWGHQLAAIMAS